MQNKALKFKSFGGKNQKNTVIVSKKHPDVLPKRSGCFLE